MKIMESVLKGEMKKLEKIVSETSKRLKTAPGGHLRIAKKRGGVEYYYKSAEVSSHNGRYMKKSEKPLVRSLAQRDYDVQVQKKAKERIKVIETFLNGYKKTSSKELYEKTNQYRKDLIDAFIISDEEYIKRWQAVEYEGKGFVNDEWSCVKI